MMNSALIDAARKQILQKYQVSPDAWLSSGMEAEVYGHGADTILKLYAGRMTLDDLLTLKEFYDSLDRQLFPYALPRIYSVSQEDRILVTIEQRLAGRQLSALLPSATNNDQLDTIMQRCLSAALAISQLELPPAFDRYKLFDSDQISRRINGDWHQFLSRFLTHKLAQVTPYLRRDVMQLAIKVQHLRTILHQPYLGDCRLIHGDFFPGNLMVDADYQITGLLDFGGLTMYGDHLFDLATGWVFFDMYDELKAEARDRYLAILLERLGEGVRGKLYRYALIYSILSANTYSSNCTDGHYLWCVDNLNYQPYWDAIE